MTRVYYKQATACVIIFDITRPQTFRAVSRWKADLDSKASLPNGDPIPCLLVRPNPPRRIAARPLSWPGRPRAPSRTPRTPWARGLTGPRLCGVRRTRTLDPPPWWPLFFARLRSPTSAISRTGRSRKRRSRHLSLIHI